MIHHAFIRLPHCYVDEENFEKDYSNDNRTRQREISEEIISLKRFSKLLSNKPETRMFASYFFIPPISHQLHSFHGARRKERKDDPK